MINRGHLSDLRGAVRLAVDATLGVTDLVENMHHTIQLRHPPVGASRASHTRGLTGLIYSSIRATTRLVGRGLDAGIAPLTALLAEGVSNSSRDALVAAVNGVYGDHLVATGNPLAIDIGLRYAGLPLDLVNPAMALDAVADRAPTAKILLFVHGLCLNDGYWSRDGQNRGEVIARKLGYTPLYLRYNSGLPIAENGRIFAESLEKLLAHWPHPVCELSIVAHSMGGLVARSACHHGHLAGHDWPVSLRKLVFIATPHHGAPLERGGNWLEHVLDLSPYVSPFTRIGKKRSAGIADLRHGNITATAKQFVPLPADVECYAMAATLAKKRSRISERLIGDGLVPLDSALGRHKDSARTLAIPQSRQWVAYGIGHNELLGRPEVYAQLSDWLE